MQRHSQPRLPLWSFIAIAAGGVITYCGVGILLIGFRFWSDLQSLLGDPVAFVAGDPELLAPFVLLLVPAILGAIATRALLRIVIGGLRDGDSPGIIAKAIAIFLASALLLVIAALFTSQNVRR
jgi:mannitol-specific phosphotransferase system IIBC component